MQTFDFPYHTQSTDYPESGTRVQLGGNYVFTSPPTGPDLRRFSLKFPTMLYYLNDEQTRTNTLSYSTEVGKAPWLLFGGATAQLKAHTAPDKSLTASLITATTAITGVYHSNQSSAIGVKKVFSVYVKDAGGASKTVKIGTRVGMFSGNTEITFNLVTGAITAVPAGITATAVKVEEGFWRVVLIITPTNASAVANVSVYSAAANTIFYVWGAQLEEGTTVSSLIRTYATAGTRTIGTITVDKSRQINMAVLEEFYKTHKMHKSFIYPHPVYGNVTCKFFSPLRVPEGEIGGTGALKDFSIELIEIVE